MFARNWSIVLSIQMYSKNIFPPSASIWVLCWIFSKGLEVFGRSPSGFVLRRKTDLISFTKNSVKSIKENDVFTSCRVFKDWWLPAQGNKKKVLLWNFNFVLLHQHMFFLVYTYPRNTVRGIARWFSNVCLYSSYQDEIGKLYVDSEWYDTFFLSSAVQKRSYGGGHSPIFLFQ